MVRDVVPLSASHVPLSKSLGRTLAEDFTAHLDHPPFDQSAMDGYAVRIADLASGESLLIVSESRAGSPAAALQPQTCARIFTGAMIPDGADAVVMQEKAHVENDHVRFVGEVQSGMNVRRRGSAIREGTRLLHAGRILDSAAIAVLASQGIAQVPLRDKPCVLVVATGDELLEGGSPYRDGLIYNSNEPMLKSLVRSFGGEVDDTHLLPLSDELAETKRALENALEQSEADVLVTAGGVSVGDYDVMRDALEQLGLEKCFWGVRIKPGKPVLYGVIPRDDRPLHVLALPGNPVSAFATAHVFLRSLLSALLGQRSELVWNTVRLAESVTHRKGRDELARAAIEPVDGMLSALLFPDQRSGAIGDLPRANALVRLCGDRDKFEAGELLPALLFATT